MLPTKHQKQSVKQSYKCENRIYKNVKLTYFNTFLKNGQELESVKFGKRHALIKDNLLDIDRLCQEP